MARFRVCPKTGLRRGAWCPEEDQILATYIAKHGHLNWRLLPQQAGLARDGKSCRLRWMNYLRPNLKRGNFTQEEDEVIVRMHERLGNRWSAIAFSLPGRSDNEIKNRWHTRLEKLSKRKVPLEETNLQSIASSSIAPLCLGNNPAYLDFGNFLGDFFTPQNSVLVTEGSSYDEMAIYSTEESSPLEMALEGLLCMGVNII